MSVLKVWDGSAWVEINVNNTHASRHEDGGADEIAVTDLVGLYFETRVAISDFAAARTSIVGDVGGVSLGTLELSPSADCTAYRVSVCFIHFHGSDPGDWTYSLYKNQSGTASATFTATLSASSDQEQVTAGLWSSEVNLDATDTYRIEATGPSTDFVLSWCTLGFKRR